ncbi:TraM recognition domain-containing protein [Cryobacterium sp. Y11]|uniref:TraM recognition domain-containing protein n=1 Tax=Cryobacterium sp. Y11 TaxID=2045016 RepID=UPI0021010BA5|nr:TraM recognition domain-containing protein [Cryobacterium sp. Y11]
MLYRFGHSSASQARSRRTRRLDESANIVRWPELPSVYSYYGSIGIILNAYFQSRAQAIDAFGKDGWQTLWDAAAHRVYGGARQVIETL